MKTFDMDMTFQATQAFTKQSFNRMSKQTTISGLKADKEKLEVDKEQWRQQATNLLAAPDRRGLLQRIFGKG